VNAATCVYIRRWIDSLRSNLHLAVSVEKLLDLMNGYLEEVGEDDLDISKVTKEDLKRCLKYDDTVKFIETKKGEVLWLWDGWRLHNLINRIIEVAAEEGKAEVVAGL
jgi:hypothetical protein